MKLTRNQELVLRTLDEHTERGGEGIANAEIDRELNSRHNRHMGYDALHGVLLRLTKRGLVRRDSRRPARWRITDEGRSALS